jgi:hypothetical protein
MGHNPRTELCPKQLKKMKKMGEMGFSGKLGEKWKIGLKGGRRWVDGRRTAGGGMVGL